MCTAVTVQNDIDFKDCIWIEKETILNQIDLLFQRFAIAVVKIGIIQSWEVLLDVIQTLKKLNPTIKIVLDPVMVAKGGTKLISNKAIADIKKKLIKKILLITPNIPEAELLTNTKIKSVKDMIKAGELLINLGAKNVLIKGGHLRSEKMNKERLVRVGEYEYSRYSEFRGMIKVIVYGCFTYRDLVCQIISSLCNINLSGCVHTF